MTELAALPPAVEPRQRRAAVEPPPARPRPWWLRWDFWVVSLMALTPLLWFREGYLVTGGDTVFPLDPITFFRDRCSIWYANLQCGQPAAINATSIIFHGLQAFYAWLGLALLDVQRAFYCTWFFGVCLASYAFAAVVHREADQAWPRVATVFVYAFNPLLFNVWEAAKASELSAYVAMPATLALVVAGVQQRLRWGMVTAGAALIAVVTAEAGGNPPVLGVMLMTYGLFALVLLLRAFRRGTQTGARLAARLAGVAAAVVLASTFWWLPFYEEIWRSIASQGALAAYNVADWLQGISTHTSLLNVMRYQGAWDWYYTWNNEAYVPYASAYLHHPAWIALSLLIPLVAYGALLWGTHRWEIVTCATLGVMTTIFAAGAHPPTGWGYAWLAQHLPFFAIYRSPYYKFGLAMALAYAVLFGWGVREIIHRWPAWRSQLSGHRFTAWLTQVRTGAILCGLLGAHAVYVLPMWNGEIMPFHAKLSSLKLSIPPYVMSNLRWLRQQPDHFRVFSLPQDFSDMYRWGYSSLAHLLILGANQSVIHGVMGTTPVDALRNATYEALYQRRTPQVADLLRLMGVRYALVRDDSWYDFYGDTDSPAMVKERLHEQTGIAYERSLGPWHWYRVAPELPRVIAADSVAAVAGSTRDLGVLTGTPLMAAPAFLTVEDADSVHVLKSMIARRAPVSQLTFCNALPTDLAVTLTPGIQRGLLKAGLRTTQWLVNEPGDYLLAIERVPEADIGNVLRVVSMDDIYLMQLADAPIGPSLHWHFFEVRSWTKGPHRLELPSEAVAGRDRQVVLVPVGALAESAASVSQWIQTSAVPVEYLLAPDRATIVDVVSTPSLVSVEGVLNLVPGVLADGAESGWGWCRGGPLTVVLHNATRQPQTAMLEMEVYAPLAPRDLQVLQDGKFLVNYKVPASTPTTLRVPIAQMAPGGTVVTVATPQAAVSMISGVESLAHQESFAVRRIAVGEPQTEASVRLYQPGSYVIRLLPPAGIAWPPSRDELPTVWVDGRPASCAVEEGWGATASFELSAGDHRIAYTVGTAPGWRLWLGPERPVAPTTFSVAWRRTSPTRYELDWPHGRTSVLMLLEAHDPAWVAWWRPGTQVMDWKDPRRWRWPVIPGQLRLDRHIRLGGYANGWFIPKSLAKRSVVLEYVSQRLFHVGLLVSGIAVVGVLAAAGLRWRRPR